MYDELLELYINIKNRNLEMSNDFYSWEIQKMLDTKMNECYDKHIKGRKECYQIWFRPTGEIQINEKNDDCLHLTNAFVNSKETNYINGYSFQLRAINEIFLYKDVLIIRYGNIINIFNNKKGNINENDINKIKMNMSL